MVSQQQVKPPSKQQNMQRKRKIAKEPVCEGGGGDGEPAARGRLELPPRHHPGKLYPEMRTPVGCKRAQNESKS